MTKAIEEIPAPIRVPSLGRIEPQMDADGR